MSPHSLVVFLFFSLKCENAAMVLCVSRLLSIIISRNIRDIMESLVLQLPAPQILCITTITTIWGRNFIFFFTLDDVHDIWSWLDFVGIHTEGQLVIHRQSSNSLFQDGAGCVDSMRWLVFLYNSLIFSSGSHISCLFISIQLNHSSTWYLLCLSGICKACWICFVCVRVCMCMCYPTDHSGL